VTDHDAQFRERFLRLGPRADDLPWRLAQLPWRHRVLLRRFPVTSLRVLDYGCGDGVFAAALARLKISSKLLALARSVVGEHGGGKS